jgi:hypothetical protein
VLFIYYVGINMGKFHLLYILHFKSHDTYGPNLMFT